MARNIAHGLCERAFICSHGVREGGQGRDEEELCRDGDGFRSGHGVSFQEYSERTEVAVRITKIISVGVEVAPFRST